MRRRPLLFCFAGLLLLFVACKDERSRAKPPRKPAAGASAPYDVKPLLRSLRSGEASRLARRLGLDQLSGLPFYDLTYSLDEHRAALDAKCVLTYRNRTGRPMAALPLQLHPNAPRELGATASGKLTITAVKALAGPKLTVKAVRPTLVELRFSRPARVGELIKVEIRFRGQMRRLPAGSNDLFSQSLASLGIGAGGSGASDYGLLAVGDGIYTISSAYPMVAPFREGRFDIDPPTRFGDLAYNRLANYRFRFTVDSGMTLVSNLVDQKRIRGKKTVYTGVGAANRDLVIVAGRALKRISKNVGGVRVSSVFTKGDRAGGARALKAAAGSLALFQKKYGRYPYTELDVAEATLVGGAGGVEFPGMVLIAGMLYRPPSKSSSPLALLMRLIGGLGGLLRGGLQGQRPTKAPATLKGMRRMDQVVETMAVFTVAHEVAHQYFAGLVAADCRRHPAVDEPLAQFAAGQYMRSVHGAAAGQKLMDLNAKMNYGVYRMVGGKDMAAAQAVNKFPSALAYAAIVYGKAPYFYVALQKKLGQARFDRTLRAAVAKHRFGLVTTRTWINTLAKASGAPAEVKRLSARWFSGKFGDVDLGVDASGDVVLEAMLGKQAVAQLKQSLALLGMSPKDLFRMLMGKMLNGQPSGGGSTSNSPLDLLQRLVPKTKGKKPGAGLGDLLKEIKGL